MIAERLSILFARKGGTGAQTASAPVKMFLRLFSEKEKNSGRRLLRLPARVGNNSLSHRKRIAFIPSITQNAPRQDIFPIAGLLCVLKQLQRAGKFYGARLIQGLLLSQAGCKLRVPIAKTAQKAKGINTRRKGLPDQSCCGLFQLAVDLT